MKQRKPENPKVPIGVVIGMATLLVVAGSIFSAVNTVIMVYNTLVTSKVLVERELANLDSEYQRRYALVDNLVAIVKETKAFEQFLMDFEKSIYIETAKAKAAATQLSLQAPEATAKRFKDEDRLTQTLSQFVEKFLVLAQHYPPIGDPQVKDRTATITALQDLKESLTQIEENVLTERRTLNDAVRGYNQNLALFPANLLSASWGFTKLQGFEVMNEDARQDAHVEF